jgi:hypothetical protein
MRKHTNTALVVMIYDSARFILIEWLLSLAAGAARRGLAIGGSGRLDAIPYLFFAAPFVIFPIMAFFLWLDRRKYWPFYYLYGAGKLAGAVAVVVWFCFYRSPALVVMLLRLAPKNDIVFQLALPAIAVCDILSVVMLIASCRPAAGRVPAAGALENKEVL